MNDTKLDALLVLDKNSLQFRVELTPEEFFKYLVLSGEASLFDVFKEIDKLIPRMNFPLRDGIPNPNNGQPFHTYLVGREYSRVIYLKFCRGYLPDTFDYNALVDSLNLLAQKAYADEFDVINGFSFEYRFWWD